MVVSSAIQRYYICVWMLVFNRHLHLFWWVHQLWIPHSKTIVGFLLGMSFIGGHKTCWWSRTNQILTPSNHFQTCEIAEILKRRWLAVSGNSILCFGAGGAAASHCMHGRDVQRRHLQHVYRSLLSWVEFVFCAVQAFGKIFIHT